MYGWGMSIYQVEPESHHPCAQSLLFWLGHRILQFLLYKRHYSWLNQTVLFVTIEKVDEAFQVNGDLKYLQHHIGIICKQILLAS